MNTTPQAASSETELKQRALELYCEMTPKPRFDWLKKRTGVPVEVLRQWAEEGCWLDARNRRAAEIAAAKKAAVADEKRESTEQLLRASKRIVRWVNDRIDIWGTPNRDIKALADTLLKMRELQNELYEELADLTPVDGQAPLVVLEGGGGT